MLLFALLNASTCCGVYPVVSRAANQTTVVAAPVLCAAGAAVGDAPLPPVGAVAVPPPVQAASTPAPALIASPARKLRPFSRAPCHRTSLPTVHTPSLSRR